MTDRGGDGLFEPSALQDKKAVYTGIRYKRLFGRSDGIRTHGLLVPNQARYQLRYTP